MLTDLLTADVIRLHVGCDNWREAVKSGTDLLVDKNCVEPRYQQAIVGNHETLGPYMVIAPGIMLAHARPEDGVKKLAMSLVTLKEPVAFGNKTNDPVKLLITLAAPNRNSHLTALSQLMELLMNAEDIRSIMDATKKEAVLAIISRYS